MQISRCWTSSSASASRCTSPACRCPPTSPPTPGTPGPARPPPQRAGHWHVALEPAPPGRVAPGLLPRGHVQAVRREHLLARPGRLRGPLPAPRRAVPQRPGAQAGLQGAAQLQGLAARGPGQPGDPAAPARGDVALIRRVRYDLSWRPAHVAALLAAWAVGMASLGWHGRIGRCDSQLELPVLPDRVAAVTEKINPNTAPVGSLRRLSGIGPVRAAAIADYAAAHGPVAFRRPEDLTAVSGIGPGMVQRSGRTWCSPRATIDVAALRRRA